MMTIYVGNLLFQTTEEDISNLFSQFGAVESVKLIKDRDTGRPRGFGFVEMEDESGKVAIEALDGKDFGGRMIKVNEAKERSGGGGAGGSRGFNGGGNRRPFGGGGGNRRFEQ